MPRDKDPERDEANRTALSEEKRFFSENLMIVDLLRNDLSRSCVPGTISVPALMKVESYATVHQLISTVRGTLQSSVTRCVAGCFPGGSMTGAPKKRTLEIIDKIEVVPRGILYFPQKNGHGNLVNCYGLWSDQNAALRSRS
jgi:anthranilate/para-aminobenzoate synthase component I